MNSLFWVLTSTLLLSRILKTDGLAPTFITPQNLSDNEHSFNYRDLEYITVNKPLSHDLAGVYCEKVLKGQLATFSDEDSLKFMAEALYEVQMATDNMWVNAKKKSDKWDWYANGRRHIQVDMGMLNDHIYKRPLNVSIEKARTCLALSRQSFEEPLLVDLDCNLLRTFICVRKSSEENNITTHSGWITVGKRQYKIFNDLLPHSHANIRCAQHDKSAKLAVVPSLDEAKILARHLLIGRPSLEYAWIGLKYAKPNGWAFPAEGFILPPLRVDPQEHAGDVYPPWRTKNPKNGGCGLLDRQLFESVSFVEADCNRPRPYICYKTMREDNEDEYVFFLTTQGISYRLYIKSLIWYDAEKYCQSHDNGILAEPFSRQDLQIYLHMMGDFRVTIQHMWIGGLHSNNQWSYPSNQKPFESIMYSPYWINNSTYEHDVEHNNLCLNIDREEHGKALIYGTQCNYPQYFLCQYSKITDSSMIIEKSSKVTTPKITVFTKRPRPPIKTTTKAFMINSYKDYEGSSEDFKDSLEYGKDDAQVNLTGFIQNVKDILIRKKLPVGLRKTDILTDPSVEKTLSLAITKRIKDYLTDSDVEIKDNKTYIWLGGYSYVPIGLFERSENDTESVETTTYMPVKNRAIIIGNIDTTVSSGTATKRNTDFFTNPNLDVKDNKIYMWFGKESFVPVGLFRESEEQEFLEKWTGRHTKGRKYVTKPLKSTTDVVPVKHRAGHNLYNETRPEEPEDVTRVKKWVKFDNSLRQCSNFSKCGYKVTNGYDSTTISNTNQSDDEIFSRKFKKPDVKTKRSVADVLTDTEESKARIQISEGDQTLTDFADNLSYEEMGNSAETYIPFKPINMPNINENVKSDLETFVKYSIFEEMKNKSKTGYKKLHSEKKSKFLKNITENQWFQVPEPI